MLFFHVSHKWRQLFVISYYLEVLCTCAHINRRVTGVVIRHASMHKFCLFVIYLRIINVRCHGDDTS